MITVIKLSDLILKQTLTSSRIWSSRPRIMGSTCSRDNLHAECGSRCCCCCSRLTILDCSSEVRTKTTMQTPTHRTDSAMQIAMPDKSLQFLHTAPSDCLCGCCWCWCSARLLHSSADFPLTSHLRSCSISDS